jgi:anion-transporting  ArsA/GET3 family ATPase
VSIFSLGRASTGRGASSYSHGVSGLQEILDSHDVIVCLGSGGVGKTTTSASVALRAALQGRRTLCLTIDPSQRLATSLGLGRMRAQEQQVDPLSFVEAGLILRGQLWAAVVDAKATFDGLVQRLAEPEAAERILHNRIYRYVSRSMPGVQEYMSMERLLQVKENPAYDLIVLDTPPTSNALDFLDAPRRMMAAVGSPAVQWLLTANRGGILSKGTAFVLRHLSRIAGAVVLTRMAELAQDFETMLEELRHRATTVDAMLHSDEVAYVVVTSPDPLAIDEAIFLNHRLQAMGLGDGALVVNRMRPYRPRTGGLGADEIRAGLELDSELVVAQATRLAAALDRAVREEQSLAAADLAQVERLRKSCQGVCSVCVVPGLERDVYDLAQLARLHAWLFGGATVECSES